MENTDPQRLDRACTTLHDCICRIRDLSAKNIDDNFNEPIKHGNYTPHSFIITKNKIESVRMGGPVKETRSR